MHPLLPLVLLAGLGVQAIWSARDRWLGRAGLVLVVLCVLHTGYASFRANAQDGADPREFLVTTQSSREVVQVRDEVVGLAAKAQREGRDLTVLVDSSQGATFPWAWYFRDLDVGYLNLDEVSQIPSDTDVVLMTENSREKLRGELAGYDGRRFPFRVWWVRDYGAMSLRGWWDWYAHRKPWNPTGGLPEWLYVRQGA